MTTSSDIKKVLINILSCNKTKLSKINKKALVQLIEELEDNDSKKERKEITEQEWYKVVKDITLALGQIMLHTVNFNYEPG